MPTGRVRSSSLSVSDDVAGFWDRKSMMPVQSRGSVCAGRYGLRAGVGIAGLGRTERCEPTWVGAMVLGSRVMTGAGSEDEACTVRSAATVLVLLTVMSASDKRSIDVEVEAGSGSARAKSRNSLSRRTRGDSIDVPQEGPAIEGSGVEEESFVSRVRAVAAAAGVEETAAWAGMNELSEGVRFGSNVSALDPDVINESSGRDDVWGSSVATPDKSSEVGMRTWAACS
jgi:hypothetical protein